jgi:uncharacterized protein (DUF58 family)
MTRWAQFSCALRRRNSVREMLQPLLRFITRYTPRKRLALVVAVTCPLWLLPGALGLYAGVAALIVIVIAAATDFITIPTRASIAIEREFPPSVGIGDDATGSYIAINRSNRDTLLEIHDRMPALVRGGADFVSLPLAAQSSKKFDVNVTGMTRGVAALGTVGVRVNSRLGLVAATYNYATTDDIKVIPSLAGVRRFRLLAMQHRLNAAGVRVLRRKGGGQAFSSLREYVRGDDPRHIDWKATSKKGKLISREFTVERSQTVLTLIDAGRGMTQLSGEYSRFEHALSSALILTDIASNAGDRVGTMVFDDEVRAFVPAQASRGALQLVRDAFVPVVASTREPDYASAFRYLAAHQNKRALIVFFTDVIDIRASQAMLAHVTRSAVRHLVLVVALRNDALFEAATLTAGTTAAALYESAAAEELIQAREAVLQRMRRAGLIVLDVSPKLMTAGVVNAYLELKNRGAL